MLVLSRKKNQQVLFPDLDIEVEILGISGNSVSVGIRAPQSVHILRGELTKDESARRPKSEPRRKERGRELRHRLDKAQSSVALAQKQLRLGREQDAENTLEEMIG